VNNVEHATAYATEAHAGQVRKYVNEPYAEHPKRVAARVALVPGMSEAAVIAALLHDVVEDTDRTLAEIEALYGPEVALLVDALTDKYTPESHPDLNRKARKALEAVRLATIPHAAKVIKMADIVDNLVGTDPADPFSAVWLKEKDALLLGIGAADSALRHEIEVASEVLRVASDAALAAKKAAKAAAKAAL